MANRKKLTEKQKAKKALDKAYESYKTQYKKAKTIYNRNLTKKLSKKNFEEAYKDYKNSGFKHPIQRMLKDQRVLTDRQSTVYERNLRRNIRKWEKQDDLSDVQQEIIKKAKNIGMKDYFLKANAEAAALLTYINSVDAWEIAVGS